jgi:hypothetical protein
MNQARSLRDRGMQQAVEHADREHANWKHDAYSFLIAFARSNRFFISEDVSDAHHAAGHPQPPTKRAWGPLYVRASRSGAIAQDGIGRSRLRHASVCPRWKSMIYRESAA